MSLANCTNTIHKIDMLQATHTRDNWGTPGAALFEALLTDPTSIRCIQIRSDFSSGTSERGTVGLRSDNNLYATWLFLHSTDVRHNRFEDLEFWCPNGIKATGWETYTTLPGGTSGHGWKLDVRIWRVGRAALAEGWITNTRTSMDLDGNRLGWN